MVVRHGILRTAGFVLAAAVLMAVSACAGKYRPDEPAPPATPFAPKPADAAVKVVDYGFTSIPLGGDEWALSYGIVLENVSATAAAVLTRVEVTATTSSGEQIAGTLVFSDQRYLPPGATTGVGRTVPAADLGLDELPADLSLKVGTRDWWPPENDTWDVPALTTSDVVLTRGGDGGDDVGFTGTVDGGGPKTIGSMSALFRDDAGRIIGGAYCPDVEGGLGLTSGPLSMRLEWGAPEDTARTEVFLNAYF